MINAMIWRAHDAIWRVWAADSSRPEADDLMASLI